MHRFSYTFVHGILFTHSVLQSFTHVIHDGVHFNLLRGFSHRTLTRNFGNTNSFIPSSSMCLYNTSHCCMCLCNSFSLVHSCLHVGVHLLRGFSYRILTRKFVNTIRFWLWLIFAILRRLLIFSALYLNHRSILDSIVSDQCHMRCHSLIFITL